MISAEDLVLPETKEDDTGDFHITRAGVLVAQFQSALLQRVAASPMPFKGRQVCLRTALHLHGVCLLQALGR